MLNGKFLKSLANRAKPEKRLKILETQIFMMSVHGIKELQLSPPSFRFKTLLASAGYTVSQYEKGCKVSWESPGQNLQNTILGAEFMSKVANRPRFSRKFEILEAELFLKAQDGQTSYLTEIKLSKNNVEFLNVLGFSIIGSRKGDIIGWGDPAKPINVSAPLKTTTKK